MQKNESSRRMQIQNKRERVKSFVTHDLESSSGNEENYK